MGPRRDGLKLFIAILLPFVVTYGVLELALRGFAGGEIMFFRTIVGETPTLFAVFKNPETRIRTFQFPVNPARARSLARPGRTSRTCGRSLT